MALMPRKPVAALVVPRVVGTLLFAGCVVSLVPHALASERFPERPIRVIVPFSPGGGSDLVARMVSEKMAEALGVSVLVDNRPGAGSTLGTALVAQAAPDGHTLLSSSASFVFSPNFYANLPYDPVKSFRPITMFARTPMVLVVHPSLPVKGLKELLELARRRPGEILYGSSGVGSNLHLNTALIERMAGIRLTHVPYKGAGSAQTALMSGEIQMLLTGIQPAIPFLRTGRMRALAVSTKERLPVVPEVPTLDEAGVRGFDSAGWFGLFAPARTPDSIAQRLHQAASQAARNPVVVKQLAGEGSVAVGNSSAEFTAFVQAEIAKWAKLIRELKI
ncbi:MAG: Bug family tripartite tricarboxylate transporter substrate binding protein [Betaproteobacteria bacterium]